MQAVDEVYPLSSNYGEFQRQPGQTSVEWAWDGPERGGKSVVYPLRAGCQSQLMSALDTGGRIWEGCIPAQPRGRTLWQYTSRFVLSSSAGVVAICTNGYCIAAVYISFNTADWIPIRDVGRPRCGEELINSDQ
jgi:hypothetical protein